MTWPPERTPRCGLGLAGGDDALSSLKPRGPTREEDYLRWLCSLRSRPQPPALAPRRDAGASASANSSAPPSPTASSAARVPPLRRGGGISASASTINISSAALPGTPKGRPQASATSAPPAVSASALATASRRQTPMTKQITVTGTRSALPPLQNPKPTPDASSLQQTDLAPPPPSLAGFAQRIIEVLCFLIYLLLALQFI